MLFYVIDIITFYCNYFLDERIAVKDFFKISAVFR